MKKLFAVVVSLATLGIACSRGDVYAQQPRQNCARSRVVIQAKNFSRGSGIEVEAGRYPQWGLNTIHNAPPYGHRINLAEYDFNACAGTYQLDVEYAAAESRPVEIYINGKLAIPVGLSATTGGWSISNQRWLHQGDVTLITGRNTLQFKRNDYFPHILAIRLRPK